MVEVSYGDKHTSLLNIVKVSLNYKYKIRLSRLIVTHIIADVNMVKGSVFTHKWYTRFNAAYAYKRTSLL